jgi:hypothetical protein
MDLLNPIRDKDKQWTVANTVKKWRLHKKHGIA